MTDLLDHLHRGGNWRYLWRSSDKLSRYLRISDPIPRIVSSNVYFGVHPVRCPRPAHERGRIEDVAAVNCLFAEYDVKDCGSEAGIETVLRNRGVLWPTVIVHSGGGWHCYWLLDQPYVIADDEARHRIADLQARWVRALGADPGAKDLARVLRLPNTLNAKYDPPRPVRMIEDWRPNAIYRLDELEWQLRHLEGTMSPLPPAPPREFDPPPDLPITSRVGALLNWQLKQGEGNRNCALYWVSRRMREMGMSETQALNLAGSVAEAKGLPRREVHSTIRSAYRGE